MESGGEETSHRTLSPEKLERKRIHVNDIADEPTPMEEAMFAERAAEKVSDIIEECPYEKDLLVDYESHRSHEIWKGTNQDETLRTICHTNKLSDWERILEGWGFDLFCRRSAILHIDAALVSALVERWKWKTNSFHLKTGESTVTLEDVSMILELPVSGLPMTCPGINNRKDYFKENWFEELTNDEVKDGYGRSGIKLKCVREKYIKLPKRKRDRTPERYRLHFLAYVVYVLGAVLLPSKSSKVIDVHYLALLQDEVRISDYAWGAAVLAHLYRALGDAAKRTSNMIAACLPLLQVWSYERFPVGQPIPNPFLECELPQAIAWFYSCKKMPNNRYRRKKGPSHSTIFYRGEFDILEDKFINWRPYSRWDEGSEDKDVSEWRFTAMLVGICRVPLIHFGTMEYHMSDRVVRQFADVHHIPEPPVDMSQIRRTTVEKGEIENWRNKCAEILNAWQEYDEGFGVVVVNNGCEDEDEILRKERPLCSHDEYMDWYRRKSKLRIQPPQKLDSKDYRPRGMYDNKEALRLMDMCMNIFERVEDTSMPDMMHSMLPDFLCHFDVFMMDVRGPGYKRPRFYKIDYGVEDRAKEEGDIMELTQSHPQPLTQDIGCSQAGHVFDSAYIEPVGKEHSIPLPTGWLKRKKLAVTRAEQNMKGLLKKKLKVEKRKFIDEHWWRIRNSRCDDDTDFFPHRHPGELFTLERDHVKCLRRRKRVDTPVMDAFLLLMVDRVTLMHSQGHVFKTTKGYKLMPKVIDYKLWVKFSNIPDSYWTSEGLSFLASAIEKPLYVDEQTSRLHIQPFAPICLKHTYGKHLPHFVTAMTIDPFLLKKVAVRVNVEYPLRPPN